MNPFLKQQASVLFIFHCNSTGPTVGQPVSSNSVSWCRVQLLSSDSLSKVALKAGGGQSLLTTYRQMISNWPGAIPLGRRSKTSQQLSYLAASQALRIFLVIRNVQTIGDGCENKNHRWLGSLILMTRYTSERCFTYSMTLYATENKK